jgi:ketosteroid isomerase-like protein
MSPKQLVQEWVRRFNSGDIDGLAVLYATDATNHQVVMEPLHGRAAIRKMFEVEFGRATMTCIAENVFEDGDWAILE